MNVNYDNNDDDNIIPQEDRILFGTRTCSISDKLIDVVDAALIEGVSSLPRLPHEKALLKSLRKVYVRNVDILEAYMGRNIFSIQSMPPSRRRKVVEAFVTNNLPEIPCASEDNENLISSSIAYPTADQIPTQEELTQAEVELKDFRTKLAALKRRRAELGERMEQLTLARRTIPSVPDAVKPFHEMVTNLVESNITLQDLTFKARAVMTKLDAEKRNRPDDSDAPVFPQKPKLGLEEEFEEASKVMTLDALQSFKKFLEQ